jgi:hypothetical protein
MPLRPLASDHGTSAGTHCGADRSTAAATCHAADDGAGGAAPHRSLRSAILSHRVGRRQGHREPQQNRKNSSPAHPFLLNGSAFSRHDIT